MKVVLADYSGFCFGVKKAIDMVYDKTSRKTEGAKLFSLGPLIHNQQVVNELEKKGVSVKDDISAITDGSIIIRSHGVPQEVYEKARSNSLDIIDATCPFVRRIQNIVKDYCQNGYEIVIIGNPKHPEVIGINGWCNYKSYIVSNEEDVKDVPYSKKLCIVAQTTIPVSHFNRITELLKVKGDKVEIFNTICNATMERQDAARKLAKEVDAMIVVGGYHSSNTQKLVEICRAEKPNATFHVESVDDLVEDDLKDFKVVGVTAGASTPQWLIEPLIEKLKKI
ncbi:4-hydroxy-3-methylbut-2-enyl diphosphate reductase [Alkaliphilus pronyensis]|uniref:4-hydroxy-3-methylbut-2-enyl diphosphate reductase n=1 Tax=Alkaliphilus pronyensis TaxID=1482732 RepID=A0A6I0F9P4_9FIRM|nr:4-hydroxy-3-methylbut-2-enyl diphosphate reductase [Alkaliphilus pronyensis]KAB3534018.1 4-hydroxy-3-methylbut-2-enyl diphosphate reductase [Alkaliphilus pronyensis]